MAATAPADDHVAAMAAHVARFNAGIRNGDFAPMTAHFTDDAELVFEGVPAGPFRGRAAITAAYAAQPPDDEIDVLDVVTGGNPTVVRYAWRAHPSTVAGLMLITWRDGQIARLVVTFDPAA